MELLHTSVAISCSVIALICFWKCFNWVWFAPKKLEKSLRQQGFNGKPYRLLIGDLKEISVMEKESKSKPIDFSHDYLPRIMPFILKLITDCGKNCYLWLGRTPAVFIMDPENIREVLAKAKVFQRVNDPIGTLLAQGLVNYNGDKWAKHRRLINPAFHLEKLKLMVPSFYLSCADMLSKWEKIVASEGSCELDVWPYLQTMSADAISRAAFGSSYEEGRKMFQLQNELATFLKHSYLSLLLIPGLRYLPTKTNRRIKHIRKEVESLVLSMIDKRMKTIEAGEPSTNDLLHILLESNFKEIQQNGSKFGMSMQDVVEECKLFYLAGQETTSTLLVWTMILLSKHQDWQARAREEVLQAFGSGEPHFEALDGLKIVTMILQEVLRLYPPISMISRTIHQETRLRNMTLPAGVMLFLPTILLHHDKKIWGDDASEFNPGRFSEGLNARGGQNCYFPFSSGPRVCIGQNFAMLEAKMGVAMILRHYCVELSPSYSHAPHVGMVTLQPQNGAHLILHKL